MLKNLKKKLKEKAFNYSKNHVGVIDNAVLAYSQEGEDLLLSKLFGPVGKGYYVDIGAHHPRLYSNTYFFYKRGWRGINVDALPGIMQLFGKVRPEDINLELGISNAPGELTYHMFADPALNTFSKEDADFRINSEKIKLEDTRVIKTYRLEEILNKHLPAGQIIDFLSIDVEGLDMEVLLSNNWSKYRPRVVIIEYLRTSLEGLLKSKLHEFMKQQNYVLFSRTVNSVFFIESGSYQQLTGVKPE
ncbi:MAG: FkbM family methyltransferase [Cytophagaceae bacterium]|jgi:FkbM family methyltransferase